jgi:hypothetical protein
MEGEDWEFFFPQLSCFFFSGGLMFSFLWCCFFVGGGTPFSKGMEA